MDKEQFVKRIRKTGTSLGVNIPNEIIHIMKLKEDDIVRVVVEKIKSK